MKRILGLALFLSLAISPMFAQQAASSQPAGDEAPATREDIERLLTTLHLREQMRNIMDVSAKQSMEMMHDRLKKKTPDISQKDLERADAMADRVMKGFDLDGVLDDMIPVYQHHLTKSDVTAMLAFYATPTG